MPANHPQSQSGWQTSPVRVTTPARARVQGEEQAGWGGEEVFPPVLKSFYVAVHHDLVGHVAVPRIPVHRIAAHRVAAVTIR